MTQLLRMVSTLALLAPAMLFGTLARADVTRIQVAGLADKRCNAYFHSRTDALTWPLVLSLKGTGVYTTGRPQQVELAVRRLYEQGRVTVLSLDKPGIEPDMRQPETASVNDALYNRYVQDDLVQCAANALAWAAEHAPAGGGQIIFSGHSEGAQVSIRLLSHLAVTGSPLAARVKALFVSGLPMGDWRTLLGAQLAQDDRSRFFLAFQRRDDAVLRSFGNLSYAYLDGVFSQETLWQTMDRLAAVGHEAEIFVYQGLTDRNTPAGPVMDFERHNRSRPKRGGLKLTARYYRAGHALNRQAVVDISRDISRTVLGNEAVADAARARLPEASRP